MNAIVVTAVLSCLNSGIYVASRMLFALARRGDAPKALLEVNDRGVPVKAILLVGQRRLRVGDLRRDLARQGLPLPGELLGRGGALLLRAHRRAPSCARAGAWRREAPERLKLRMWFFPWLTYAAIAAMVAVIVAMALVDDVRSQLIPSFISLAVVLAAGWLRYRQAGARAGVRRTQPSRT